jgi:glycosyltransferase involved in cell wall biosynthesis
MTPAFTVIIPVYNGAATLAKAIDSVLGQTWSAHEIIVVDDGSTDATAAVAARYGDKIRYVRQPNVGVSAARNAGAQLATGEWLAFLDADDWYYPQRLRLHAEFLQCDGALDFLTGDYDYVRPDGSRLSGSMEKHAAGKAMLRKAADTGTAVMELPDFEAFVADHFGDTHTLSVPRKTFLELGGYPVGYRVCEDVFFLVKLCAVSRRVGVVCRPLAAYLIHEGSATRRDPLRAQSDNVRTLVAMRAAARDYPPPVRRGVRQRLHHGRLNLAYAQLQANHKSEALRAVLPTLWESPGLMGLRDLGSILKG